MEAIHPTAAKTLRQAEVPLRVANAFEPGDPGTLIDDSAARAPAVEIVTGLPVVALEVFEQDMVGVKGYDSAILEALRRHKVRIVSKTSNANTITHYVEASLKSVRRVEQELTGQFPSATVTMRSLAIASAIGRDLSGLGVLSAGLLALEAAGVAIIAAHQCPRNVDAQFIIARDALEPGIRALHRALVETDGLRRPKAA
jgi:aspartate kinase